MGVNEPNIDPYQYLKVETLAYSSETALSALEMHTRSTRWPARLDIAQGATGLILVLFMWAHMLFVSSILLGKDAMYWVARFFEGEPILGKPSPILVSFVALGIFLILCVHAVLSLRKVPSNYRQFQNFHHHLTRFSHPDTWLWYLQVLSGFVLMFLVSIHIYQMAFHPEDIGPYASSDRVWSGRMWPLYLVLLFVVEIHGGIGVYRLLVKWGVFLGENPQKNRRRLQRVKWILTFFFLVLGLVTLAAYMKIGADHSGAVGERYTPSTAVLQKTINGG